MVLLRKLYRCAFAIGCLASAQAGYAYTVVTFSTSAPSGLEKSFLANTTNQYLGSLTSNPLASNTYALKLFGVNPNYVPSSCFSVDVAIDSGTLAEDLKALAAAGPTIIRDPYLYGYAAGMHYSQQQDSRITEGYGINCSTPLANVSNWNLQECYAIINAVNGSIIQQSGDVPAVIDPDF